MSSWRDIVCTGKGIRVSTSIGSQAMLLINTSSTAAVYNLSVSLPIYDSSISTTALQNTSFLPIIPSTITTSNGNATARLVSSYAVCQIIETFTENKSSYEEYRYAGTIPALPAVNFVIESSNMTTSSPNINNYVNLAITSETQNVTVILSYSFLYELS